MRHPLRRGTARPLMLDYVDGKDDRSLRKVTPIALLLGDGRRTPASTYLQARCSVAKATRSFRMDRIQELSDAATGEVLSVPDWLTTLHLGEARPFTWADEEDDDAPAGDDVAEEAQVAAALPVARHRWLVWRVGAYALVIGYLLGRLRLIHALLRMVGVHQARWL